MHATGEEITEVMQARLIAVPATALSEMVSSVRAVLLANAIDCTEQLFEMLRGFGDDFRFDDIASPNAVQIEVKGLGQLQDGHIHSIDARWCGCNA
ncbi:hypothetical protein DWU99_02240 [Dyella psychrodurans]|uniref:Uncharacterized protein n=1 Tax=Dyella psychrodurans TaxID=1927960 RepID=A0A370XD22_9GAMM|nr:hypothetical protein DWU99_02240 [Dyella psychrodurans]